MLRIPLESLELVADEDYGRWLGNMEIGGVPFHVEALKVYCADDGTWRTCCDDMQVNLDQLQAAANSDTGMQHVEIDGWAAVLFIYPHDR